jgi:hydroxymethylpyrimidine pyrophosphatase-like HAD family hydrolase
VLSIRTIATSDLRNILAIGRELELLISLYTCANVLGEPNETVYTDVRTRASELDINAMPFRYTESWDAVDLSSAVAVLLETPTGRPKNDLSYIREALGPSVRVTSSGGPFYEVSSSEVSKGHALQAMVLNIHSLGTQFKSWKRFSDLTAATTMAIGDNLNDVEMLRVAGVAIAVSNSVEEVKKVADYITDLPAGRGAVEALRLLLDVKKYRAPNAPI